MQSLNCPFCPAQGFSVSTEKILELGMGLVKYRCISRHEFFVEKEKVDGEPETSGICC